jgi:hypothetical protein
MKQTDLNLFYQFGQTLNILYERLNVGVQASTILNEIMQAENALVGFLRETNDYGTLLEDTRASAQAILNTLNEIIDSVRFNMETVITVEHTGTIFGNKFALDSNFEREQRKLSVFAVTPKALLDTQLLIEKAERKFGDVTRSVFNERVIHDLRQAGRCLAFEVPTAVAFHVMRATDSHKSVLHNPCRKALALRTTRLGEVHWRT